MTLGASKAQILGAVAKAIERHESSASGAVFWQRAGESLAALDARTLDAVRRVPPGVPVLQVSAPRTTRLDGVRHIEMPAAFVAQFDPARKARTRSRKW